MNSFDYSTFLSPFTWRYGSPKMRQIWSEVNKRKTWRRVWVALAKAQYEEGLVSKKELDDIIAHKDDIDINRSREIEKEIGHEPMSEVKAYAEQAKIGGGKIHLGATSMDIEDNADAIRFDQSLTIIEEKLITLLTIFTKRIDEFKNLPCIGYTHLQAAEPTTVGYRLAFYAQDLLFDYRLLQFVKTQIKTKGMRGAVGTAASHVKLLDKRRAKQLEEKVMKELSIEAATIVNQTAPKKTEYFIAFVLSSIAASLYKFSFDLRIMQSPGFGEWQEPFGKKQIGSSAMPFKKNPRVSEQICSLSRLVFHLSGIARDNSAHTLLERTLDDSANRRSWIPEMFLAVDDTLKSSTRIVEEMIFNKKRIQDNLSTFAPFAATEGVLMAAVKKGADRQEMHEILRELSMKSWEEVQNGRENPLKQLLITDSRITKFLKKSEIEAELDPKTHIGLASDFCEKLLSEIKNG